MKVRLSESHAILNFLEFYDCYAPLEKHLARRLDTLDVAGAEDWTLTLQFICRSADCVAVYKRGTAYPASREKLSTIVIPIPSRAQAPYGIEAQRFVSRPPLELSKFYTLPVSFGQHRSLFELMLDSATRGIDELSARGVVVGGVKVQTREGRQASG